MNQLKLAIYAIYLDIEHISKNHIAQALLLHNTENDMLVCEIHIGRLITRFTPSQDFFLEDVLWKLNNYCQFSDVQLENEVHYPDPPFIEDELGHDFCMSARKFVHHRLIESGIFFHVINWSFTRVEEKVKNLSSLGVNIEAVDLIYSVKR
jgi:hypothetical protein